MPDEQHVQPETIPGDAQFLQGCAAAAEIATGHQGQEALDPSRLERDALAAFPFYGHPGFPGDPIAFNQSHGGGVAGQFAVLQCEQHHIILALLIFAELGKGLAEGAWIEIDAQGA